MLNISNLFSFIYDWTSQYQVQLLGELRIKHHKISSTNWYDKSEHNHSRALYR
jgi:hypothetical protein